MSIKAKSTKPLNIKYRGTKVVQQFFEGNYTKRQIKEHVQKLSDSAKTKGHTGEMLVSLKYADVGWRSGYFSKFGEPVILYDHTDSDEHIEEPTHYQQFAVYWMKPADNRGGASDEYNNCLYHCLEKLLGDRIPWKFAVNMKKFLKLKASEKISIDLIPMLEQKLKKYKINVTGDHIYSSTMDSPYEINLKLINEHYTIDDSRCMKVHGVAFKDKLPLMYIIGNNDDTKVYDGQTFFNMSREEFTGHRNKPIESKYTLIHTKNIQEELIEKEFIEWKECADALKKASKNEINMYRTGTFAKTAVKKFMSTQKYIIPETIKQDETNWINKASYKAMIYATEYKGDVHKYDFTAMYLSSMAHKLMKFAVRRGNFKNITNEQFDAYNGVIPYGIFRCEVENTNNKLFVSNSAQYYTHIDLRRAFELKMKITLQHYENQPNALLYADNQLVSGDMLFGRFVHDMFELRKAKVAGAKKVDVSLWGKLSQTNYIPVKADSKNEQTTEIYDDREIVQFIPIDENVTEIRLVKQNNYFETDFARIKPFIIARGRARISQFMEPYLDTITHCHTDGFLSTKKLDIISDNSLGNVKYEGCCKNAHVKNCIRVINQSTGEKAKYA